MVAWDRFVSLWYVKPDPNAPPTPHLHGDSDLPFSPLVPTFSSLPTSPATLNKRGRLAQVVLGALFLLGLYELAQAGTSGRGGARSRPAKMVDSKSLKLQGRDPYRVLAQLVVPPAPATRDSVVPPRYQTHLPGVDSLWMEPDRFGDAATANLDATTAAGESYEELSEIGDTTAIVLHWKRTDNVALILAHLCQYTFFDTVLVWNNNPEIQLSHKVRTLVKGGGPSYLFAA